MALVIYRYHSPDCKVHTFDLTPRQKRFFRDCDCSIWITGTTHDGVPVKRGSLKTREWAVAEAKLRSLGAKIQDKEISGPTIEDCCKRFRDGHVDVANADTLEQHELVHTRLQGYAKSLGKTFIRELDVDFYEDFVTYAIAPESMSTTKGTMVSKLKVFLREAFRRGWITEAMAERLKKFKAVYEKKQPYKAWEIIALLDGAEKLNGGTTGYATNGKSFRLLLELQHGVGLRVSDAVRYDPNKCVLLKELGVWQYTFEPVKQRKGEILKTAVLYLADPLKTAIDNCKWFSTSLPFAYQPIRDTRDRTDDTHERAVYERMQAIGERCVPEVMDCRPHRLRDTFAVNMLVEGYGVDEVSRALYHGSVAVTMRYYSPWIVDRENRQARIMAKKLTGRAA